MLIKSDGICIPLKMCVGDVHPFHKKVKRTENFQTSSWYSNALKHVALDFYISDTYFLNVFFV